VNAQRRMATFAAKIDASIAAELDIDLESAFVSRKRDALGEVLAVGEDITSAHRRFMNAGTMNNDNDEIDNNNNNNNDNNNNNNNNRDMQQRNSMTDECIDLQLSGVKIDDDILHSVHYLLEMCSTNETRPSQVRFDFEKSYLSLVMIFNLKDNELTDLSCNLLSLIVERSSILQLLDLRGNAISIHGVNIFQRALKKNESVLYVSQFQDGLMLEGHRNISEGTSCANDLSTHELKHSLRIDLRCNMQETNSIDNMIDVLEALHHSPHEDVKKCGDSHNRLEFDHTKQSNPMCLRLTHPRPISTSGALFSSPSLSAPTPNNKKERPKRTMNLTTNVTGDNLVELTEIEAWHSNKRTPSLSSSNLANGTHMTDAIKNTSSALESSKKNVVGENNTDFVFNDNVSGQLNSHDQHKTAEQRRTNTFNIYTAPYENKKPKDKQLLAMKAKHLNTAASAGLRSLEPYSPECDQLTFPDIVDNGSFEMSEADSKREILMKEDKLQRNGNLQQSQLIFNAVSIGNRSGKLF
jgi:hypothetical protein